MEEHVSRHWPVWALVLVMGFSFYWVAKSWNSGKIIVAAEESYEMVRPNTFEPQYDLSGRKIVRNLQKQRIASLNGPEAQRTPLNAKAPTAPAKIADAKKKNNQAKAQNKKATLSTRVVSADSQKMTSSSDQGTETAYSGTYANNSVPQSTATDKQNVTDKDTTKVSASQWRDLLLSSPTVENADKFYAAYKKGEVNSASFYAIADELLSNADKNRQQAGLQVLGKEYSVQSFQILSKHYSDPQAPSDLKASMNTVIQSYGQSARISVLSQVLASKDENAAEVATEVIASAVSVQGTAQTQGDRGGIRSPGSSSQIDKGTWKNILPSLVELSNSNNSNLAERAQSLIASIESLTST